VAILLVGIGNLIMGDDGVGVRVVQHLSSSYGMWEGVRLLDGGTLGLDLLPHLEGVERLLLVDAIDRGDEAGTLFRLEGDQVPTQFGSRLSPHQVGLQDLLAVAELQGTTFGELVLLGVQPQTIELGLELSEAVEASFPALVGEVLAQLERWGVEITPRG
jgi:hydrogenase maturation protease